MHYLPLYTTSSRLHSLLTDRHTSTATDHNDLTPSPHISYTLPPLPHTLRYPYPGPISSPSNPSAHTHTQHTHATPYATRALHLRCYANTIHPFPTLFGNGRSAPIFGANI